MIAPVPLRDPLAQTQAICIKALQRWDIARSQTKMTLPYGRIALRCATLLVRAAAKDAHLREPAQALVDQIADRAASEDAALEAQGKPKHIWLNIMVSCATLGQRLEMYTCRAVTKRNAQPMMRRDMAQAAIPSAPLAASIAPRRRHAAHLAPVTSSGLPKAVAQHAHWLAQQRAKQKTKR